MSADEEPAVLDEGATRAPAAVQTADDGGSEGTGADGADDLESGAAPSWWHRDHPTFTALTGFFTGLAFIILIPGVYAAILSALVDQDRAEGLFPFVLVFLAIPLGLVIAPRTRRFGRYMCIGMVTTLLVVVGVAALVLWYLITYQS